MSSIGGEDITQWDAQGLSGHEEKILVSVRLRPLNEKEIGRNDVSDWECINDDTIIFKNSLPERSLFPIAYKFDRVFGCESSTRQVYEEGAKGVALSVISGINSTVFAYGQTSSGKTYTMSGITEHTVADIYDYMRKHSDREFVLKFSALEIYNESVRDLLSTDSTPLRLLDDPERGTVVEKLTEETLEDWSHLKELLSICEAQRQIGETSLNEMSSRSHQILRLTVDSSAHELLGAENSSTLTASVNFVDLAGSERASQASSAGMRLKEGCHINRSLLTLGTVIRKLSKGRNAHIPYRDSKLTRILQNSLGGNARTAIICTMSPARSHVEQSRNTLLFASCAKEVSTSAQVNVVMSEKALVKQLQRELARLESELRSLGSISATSNTMALLKEKELLIEKMDKEIKELTRQRDLAQSRVEDLLQSVGEHQFARALAKPDQLLKPCEQNAWVHENSASESSEVVDPHRFDVASNTYERSESLKFNKLELQLPENSEDCFLLDSISPQLFMNKFFGPDPCKGWENIVQKSDEDSDDQWKEVRCIEMEEPSKNKKIKPDAISSLKEGARDPSHTHSGPTYEALKQKIQDMQKTIDYLASPYYVEQSPCSSETGLSGSRSLDISRSKSCKAVLTSVSSSPWFREAEQMENTPHYSEKDFPSRPEGYQPKFSESESGSNLEKLRRKDSGMSDGSFSMDEKEQNIKMSDESDIASIPFGATGLDEVVNSKSEKKFGDDLDAEAKTNESSQIVKNGGSDIEQGSVQSPSNWPLEFEKQRREIIELWDVCYVPLVHRTYFFMLFKGDPSDSVYMEVELRRLSFLKYTLSNGSKIVDDGKIPNRVSSRRALNREREMLGKKILKKFSSKEREALYKKWGIELNTKQRRLQLTRRLWTDTNDMDHIKESAALVAKLVGFVESGHTPKEMFGLSFAPRPIKFKSFSWKNSMSSIL
ncbi:kinesin-like protein KIN-7E [Cornus florida]|uniref:kinesin-like protein KIN-7E n=1 Tax=Cornus florida TaxID=4283 RepID=UPI00289EFA8E|nr:kinesin-like protein KIN-7E [Cornus florida]